MGSTLTRGHLLFPPACITIWMVSSVSTYIVYSSSFTFTHQNLVIKGLLSDYLLQIWKHKKSGGCMKTAFENPHSRKALTEWGHSFWKIISVLWVDHYRNSAFPVITTGLGYLKNDSECLLWNRYKCQTSLSPLLSWLLKVSATSQNTGSGWPLCLDVFWCVNIPLSL